MRQKIKITLVFCLVFASSYAFAAAATPQIVVDLEWWIIVILLTVTVLLASIVGASPGKPSDDKTKSERSFAQRYIICVGAGFISALLWIKFGGGFDIFALPPAFIAATFGETVLKSWQSGYIKDGNDSLGGRS